MSKQKRPRKKNNYKPKKIDAEKKLFWTENKKNTIISLAVGAAIAYFFYTKTASKEVAEDISKKVINIEKDISAIKLDAQKEMQKFQVDNFNFLRNTFKYGYRIYYLTEEGKLFNHNDAFYSRFTLEISKPKFNADKSRLECVINEINDRVRHVIIQDITVNWTLAKDNRILFDNVLSNTLTGGYSVVFASQLLDNGNYIFVVGITPRA